MVFTEANTLMWTVIHYLLSELKTSNKEMICCLTTLSIATITQHRPRWPLDLVCGRSLSGIEGSNPAGGVDVRLSCLLCVEKVCDELIAGSEECYLVDVWV